MGTRMTDSDECDHAKFKDSEGESLSERGSDCDHAKASIVTDSGIERVCPICDDVDVFTLDEDE